MRINWVPQKNIDESRVQELLHDTTATNAFTNYGPNVRKLEQVIREKFVIEPHKAVICVNNGSTAIHAAVSAMDLFYDRKLKWVTQSFTFPASAQGPLSGVKIVDIDREGGLDLDQVSNDIDGIIVTNIFGNLVDIQKYTDWADQNGRLLLFDNAATSFSIYKGKNAVNYGNVSTISFHHTKPIGFGEGGAIIIDKCYEDSVRRIINFGIDNERNLPWNRLGSNYKMSDIAAVYILQFLDNLEHIIQHHKMLYNHLLERLDELDTDITVYPNFSDTVPFVSCICLFSDRFDNRVLDSVMKAGIYCRKYYHPLEDTPVASKFIERIICLPCTTEMTIGDIDNILNILG